jgi:hypothetical protein
VCLLIAGCSGGASTVADSGTAASGVSGVPSGGGVSHSAAGGARLTGLAPVGGLAVIQTAALTVRTSQVTAAAARAAQLARNAGGYVASERSTASRAHPASGRVQLELKVPAAAYPATLAALSRLGTVLSSSQRAQDVTQTVADVASRVTSAGAAIAQLRKLLSRAGSVGGLLSVQDQINAEEAALESLQAQQRALAHATTYSTVSLELLSKPVPAVQHHRHRAGGFAGGLAAGWRALRIAVAWLLTGAGAALPFLAVAAVLAALGYRARRWRTRHRAGAEAGAGE